MKKTRVGILFGGKSAEHEVALQSAKNIIENIDQTKYEVVLIGVDKNGHWHLGDKSHYLLNSNDPKQISLNKSNQILNVSPGGGNNFLTLTNHNEVGKIDVVFPVMHGTYGEDGTIQGFLKLANIPFVGPGVLSSSVGMDKDFTKRLLRDAGIPTCDFICIHEHQKNSLNTKEVVDRLGLPLFVKPANAGSSVGVTKVKEESQLIKAIHHALEFDSKILVEKFVKGREIECSVLGNEDDPMVSVPGEIIPNHEFYSYEAKYIDENGALTKIPADLPKDVIKRVQSLAIDTFRCLGCEGMARVDFFLTESSDLYVNEINTIPGFTKISMYPKMWEHSGIKYSDLIDRLIQLALKRAEREQKLKTSYS